MPKSKTAILFIFSLLFFFCCNAQDSNKYVYQDSSTKIATDTSSTTENTSVLADTVIRFNNLSIPQDSINAIKNSKPFAYAKNLDSLLMALKKKNETQKNVSSNRSDWLENLLASSLTKILLWSLAGFFIAYIVYKLFFIQGSSLKAKTRNKVNQVDDEYKNAKIYNYDKLVAKAINDKNYRIAVRYLYLQSLQKLAENHLINLEAEKTNYQYINELNNSIYKDDFLWLTLNYEYIWYGEFDLREEDFYQLKNNFTQFNNRLKKN